jgi:hypothetical protein
MPRKPKVVTPAEDNLDELLADLDLEDLVAAAAAKAGPGALMPPPPDLADLASVLRPAWTPRSSRRSWGPP